MEQIREYWPMVVAFFTFFMTVVKVYYDYLQMKINVKSYQDTTTTTLKALETAKQDRHREVENKIEQQRKEMELEIKLAKSETEKSLLEYKQENSKRLDEQSKLIHQLLLDTKEIGVNVNNISNMLSEIKTNQRDNQNFREEFYKEQAKRGR